MVSLNYSKTPTAVGLWAVGVSCPWPDYFSPAPQAEPQATGFGSASLLSPAPQAEPQAPEGVPVSASAQRYAWAVCFIDALEIRVINIVVFSG